MTSLNQIKVSLTNLLKIFVFASIVAAATNERVSYENLQQLQHIRESMNDHIDPCDNFYRYACGNWSVSHLGNDYMNITTLLERTFEALVDKLIAEMYPNPQYIKRENQTFMEKAVTYYYSCRNRKNYTTLPYFEILKPAKDKEWPLIQELLANNHSRTTQMHNSNSTANGRFDVFLLLGELFSYGLNNVLINLTANRTSNGSLVIVINTPEIFDYEQFHIEQFLNQFNASEKMWYKYLDEIKQTHSHWQKIYIQNVENKHLLLTYDQVKLNHHQLDVFLQAIWPDQLKNADVVILTHPKYIGYLERKHWRPTESDKLENYFLLQFHRYLAENHIAQCNRALHQRMHLAVNFFYNQEIFQPRAMENINALTQLLKKIHKHLVEIINENNLRLNPEQLQILSEQIGNFNINIGNLPDIVAAHAVDEFYQHLTDFDVNNFAGNNLQLLKQRVWEQINCPNGMICGSSTVSTITNFPDANLLIIPFATFIPPINHINFHSIFSISLMGTLIAHEIAHSLDPAFLQTNFKIFQNFTQQSRVKNTLECLQNQDPLDFIGGRVADLLGARTSYRAYSQDSSEQPSFTSMPWQKLFFQNLAQYFCRETYGISEERHRNIVRLNSIAMNLKEFAEAFNCSAGSKMNPVKRCRFY